MEGFMAGESKVTTDHETIRKWAEARDGKPATVKQTEHGDGAGLLRIDFPGYSGKGSLEEITWDEFFAKFDEKHLAFLYQDTTSSGEESRFFKLVSRDTAEHIETEKAQSPKTEEKAHSQKASAHKSDEQAQKTDEKEKAQSSKASEKSSQKTDEQTHKTHKTDQKEKAQSSKTAEKSSHKTDEQTHKTHKTDEKEKTHK
jgi:hypothetical protein